ncbi:hypothetical protein [Thermoflavimicrobium daqui]|jgi:hypothetical protein|uniref:Uncharacterized protein n=1 Tax=Thermoflavimicrobium daqui TaxID=2137476 RepID=A0A364K9G8_9BACL|nr:hypothetical protein [Thermoflavimicrobium daqui]RAL26933.1 hypothetical protein DL897_02485 [Thermoflavimicrobium daqui]
MFIRLFYNELLKTKRSMLWILVLIAPIADNTLGISNFFNHLNRFMDPGDNGWIEAWTQVELFLCKDYLSYFNGSFCSINL